MTTATATSPRHTWIDQQSDPSEYAAAWDALAAEPVNAGQRYPHSASNDGEAWQYMGTYETDGIWQHEFRHREHPATQAREYRNIPASPGWQPTGKVMAG